MTFVSASAIVATSADWATSECQRASRLSDLSASSARSVRSVVTLIVPITLWSSTIPLRDTSAGNGDPSLRRETNSPLQEPSAASSSSMALASSDPGPVKSQPLDRPADRLICCPAVNPCGGSIPVRHDAHEIGGDNRLPDTVEHVPERSSGSLSSVFLTTVPRRYRRRGRMSGLMADV